MRVALLIGNHIRRSLFFSFFWTEALLGENRIAEQKLTWKILFITPRYGYSVLRWWWLGILSMYTRHSKLQYSRWCRSSASCKTSLVRTVHCCTEALACGGAALCALTFRCRILCFDPKLSARRTERSLDSLVDNPINTVEAHRHYGTRMEYLRPVPAKHDIDPLFIYHEFTRDRWLFYMPAWNAWHRDPEKSINLIEQHFNSTLLHLFLCR